MKGKELQRIRFKPGSREDPLALYTSLLGQRYHFLAPPTEKQHGNSIKCGIEGKV
jgi:hypothetical protein